MEKKKGSNFSEVKNWHIKYISNVKGVNISSGSQGIPYFNNNIIISCTCIPNIDGNPGHLIYYVKVCKA